MKNRIIRQGNHLYILATWVEVADYDGERYCYEWWHQYDGKTGKFLRYVFIAAKEEGDTPENVPWDFSTPDLQRAEAWYHGEQYKVGENR